MQETESGIREILGKEGSTSPFTLVHELEETMFRHFGIFREGKEMEEGLRKVRALGDRFRDVSISNRDPAVNQALVRTLEIGGMLRLAEAVAEGALARKESRGSHFRRDFPGRDDTRFLAHTIAGLKDGKIQISYKPVTLGMFEVGERGY